MELSSYFSLVLFCAINVVVAASLIISLLSNMAELSVGVRLCIGMLAAWGFARVYGLCIGSKLWTNPWEWLGSIGAAGLALKLLAHEITNLKEETPIRVTKI